MPALIASGRFGQAFTTSARSGGRGTAGGWPLCVCCVRFVSVERPEVNRSARAGVRSLTDVTPASSWRCPGCDTERPVQDSCRPIPVSPEKVEAGGIEPPCRGTSAEVSTCVFHRLAFLDPQDSGGQDSSQTRARTYSFPRNPARRKVASSLLLSPIPASQARPDGRRS